MSKVNRFSLFFISCIIFMGAFYSMGLFTSTFFIAGYLISCIIFSAIIENYIFFRVMKKKDNLKTISFSIQNQIMNLFLWLMFLLNIFNILAENNPLSTILHSAFLIFVYSSSIGVYIGDNYLVSKGVFVKISDIKSSDKQIISSIYPAMEFIEYTLVLNNNKKPQKFSISRFMFPEDIEQSLDKRISASY